MNRHKPKPKCGAKSTTGCKCARPPGHDGAHEHAFRGHGRNLVATWPKESAR